MTNPIRVTLICLAIFLLLTSESYAQRYTTRNGTVRLSYRAPHGLIEAVNRQVNAGLDVQTGEFRLQILMLSFRFNGAYHQEKFNDYFTKNAHFANSSFRGVIENLDQIDFERNGTYRVDVRGDLSLRTITGEVAASGDFVVKDDVFQGESVFEVPLREFGVNVPSPMSPTIQVAMQVSVRRH